MKKWNSPDIESLSFMSTESGTLKDSVECNKTAHLYHNVGLLPTDPNYKKNSKNGATICPALLTNPSQDSISKLTMEVTFVASIFIG